MRNELDSREVPTAGGSKLLVLQRTIFFLAHRRHWSRSRIPPRYPLRMPAMARSQIGPSRALRGPRIARSDRSEATPVLRRPFRDGTTTIDLDPRSLLSRLAAAVPPPRQHGIRYAGVLAAASKWRAKVVPPPLPSPAAEPDQPHELPPTPVAAAHVALSLPSLGRAPPQSVRHRRHHVPTMWRPVALARAGQGS